MPYYEKPTPVSDSNYESESAPYMPQPVQTQRETVEEIPTTMANINQPSGIEQPAFESPPVETLSILDYPYTYALILYLFFASAFLFLIAASRLRIRNWIVRSEAVMDPRVIEIFQRVRERLSIPRDIIIVENDHVPCPMTCRTFKPVVVLPVGFGSKLADEELTAVAVHEMTHIRRNDMFVLALVSLVRALFFFQPFVWLAAREISFIVESSCDTAVLDYTGTPTSYAAMLARLARDLPKQDVTTDFAVGIVFSKSMFMRRVEAILSKKRDHLCRLSKLALAGISIAALAILVIALALPLSEAREKGDMVEVRGVVMYKGEFVKGAEVYICNLTSSNYIFDLHPEPEKMAVSSKDGNFSFEFKSNILDRNNNFPKIVVYHPDFAVSMIILDHEINYDNMIFNLEEPVELRGKVIDNNGSPISGAEIMISILQMENITAGRYFPGNISELVSATDKNGVFKLKNLPSKSFIKVEIKAKGYGSIQYPDETNNYIVAGMSEITAILGPSGEISGKAIDKNTGKSLKNISVCAVSLGITIPSSEIVKTDRNGMYTLKNLSPGVYNVALYHNDLPDKLTAVYKPNVVVTSGKTSENIDIELYHGGIVSGHVFDESFNPIEGVEITAFPAERNTRVLYGKTTSGKDGSYSIRVPSGNIKLAPVSPREFRQYSWGGLSVNISDNDTKSGIDFHLSRGKTVTGKVITSDNIPVAGTMITYHKLNGIRTEKFVSDDHGEFSIQNLEEKDVLTIEAINKEQYLTGLLEYDLEKNSPLVLTLESYETASVSGRIIDNEGIPVRDARIKLSKMVKIPRKSGRQIIYSMFIVPFHYVDVTDENGFFHADGLIVGHESQYLTVEREGFKSETIVYSREINAGFHELDDIVLEKEDADRWLEGKIIDDEGRAVVGARLYIQGYSKLVEGRTDNNGRYRLDGLKRIVESRISVDHNDYGFYRFETVPTNQIFDITFTIPEYQVAGRVVNQDGEPVPFAEFHVRGSDTLNGFTYVGNRADGNGRFTIKNVIDEVVTLSISSQKDMLWGTFENIEANGEEHKFVLHKMEITEPQQRISSDIKANKKGMIFFDPPPEINVASWINGEPITLDGLKGRIVILDFWSSKIPQSVRGLTIMKALLKAFPDDLTIIGIHEQTEDVASLKAFLEAHKINYTVAIDSHSSEENSMGRTFDAYGLTKTNFPNMIIDRSGKVHPNIYDSNLEYKLKEILKMDTR